MNVLITLLALLFSGFVSAAPLKNIVVFGDSLSDNGNLYEYMERKLPESPPYYEGRFTNGPVWVEKLAELYFPKDGKGRLLDYAFGGAGVSNDSEDDGILFTLKREIDSYLLAHQDKADENSLFIVWIGANNYLGIPENADKTVTEVNAGIKHGLERLAKAGAKHVLVLNLPDLGKIPVARLFDATDALSAISIDHNTRLMQTLDELKQDYKDVQWLQYDVYQMMGDVLADPGKYGFSNTLETCYDVIVDKPSQQSMLKIAQHLKFQGQVDCSSYLFFDPVHPSAPAHDMMALRVRDLLTAADIQFVD